MTFSADELMRRLQPKAPPPTQRLARPGPAWLRDPRLVAIALLGLAMTAGVLFDHPKPEPGPAAPSQARDRVVISPDALPATTDGHALTFGDLIDLYGLEDETLRRSLEATFQRPFSLDDARRYRTVAVGKTPVTLVLRPEPAGALKP